MTLQYSPSQPLQGHDLLNLRKTSLTSSFHIKHQTQPACRRPPEQAACGPRATTACTALAAGRGAAAGAAVANTALAAITGLDHATWNSLLLIISAHSSEYLLFLLYLRPEISTPRLKSQ